MAPSGTPRKRKVQSEDIIKEIKKHSYYMKPGERRRAKEALSRKRLRKKQRREPSEPGVPFVISSVDGLQKHKHFLYQFALQRNFNG